MCLIGRDVVPIAQRKVQPENPCTAAMASEGTCPAHRKHTKGT